MHALRHMIKLLLQLDLSSAFDTLDIITLLRRLRYSFGISGPALNWVSSYLVRRSQSVRVGQQRSSSTDCQYGVPQGSVLGPLLFTLYVAPIANVVNSFGVGHTQYADDTQLYVALKDDKAASTLAECTGAVQHWLDINGLSMNPDKTEAIVIGTSARQRAEGPVDDVNLGGVSVKPTRSVRSLGVTIDDTLSFNDHVDSICRSSNFHLRALRHIRKYISDDTAKTIARSMVNGRLDYCNSMLYRTSASNIRKLQRVQNSMARIVTRSTRADHITSVLADLHWLPVHYRINFKIAVTTFKVLTTREPHYLADLIELRVPARNLRSGSRNLLRDDKAELVFADRAFCHAAPAVWNSLPQHVTADLSSLTTFKRLLKTEFYNQAFRH